MYVKLVDDVHFDFKITDNCKEYNIGSGEGKLYLSNDGIILSDGTSWYSMPIQGINDIEAVEGNRPGLHFHIPGLSVLVRGHQRAHLWALRHFLLPFLGE